MCFKRHEDAVKAVEAENNKVLEDEAPIPIFRKEGAEVDPSAPTTRAPKLFVGKAVKKADRERQKIEKIEAARRERAAKTQGCNLYVRNLDDSVDDDRLRKEFEVFGAIQSARVARNAEDQRPRGFGFVCFANPEDAQKAKEALNRKILANKPLYVTFWESKDARAETNAKNVAMRAGGPGTGPAAGGARGGPAGAVPFAAGGGMGPNASMGFNPNMMNMNNPMAMLQMLMSAQSPQMQQQFARMFTQQVRASSRL